MLVASYCIDHRACMHLDIFTHALHVLCHFIITHITAALICILCTLVAAGCAPRASLMPADRSRLQTVKSLFTVRASDFCNSSDAQSLPARPSPPLLAPAPSFASPIVCDINSSLPGHDNFDEAFGRAIREHLAPWLKSRRPMDLRTLHQHLTRSGLVPWCRLQTCLIRGRIYVRAFGRSKEPGRFTAESLGASRQHAALLGFAELLRSQQRLARVDVCISLNCQDRPAIHKPPLNPRNYSEGTVGHCQRLRLLSRSGSPRVDMLCNMSLALQRIKQPPALALSYMTTDDHHDVPWPDYLHWGKPQHHVAHWQTMRDAILQQSRLLPYTSRQPRMLYASKLMHTDRSVAGRLRNFFFQYMPLRFHFTRHCLERCTEASGTAQGEEFLDLEWEPGRALSRLYAEAAAQRTEETAARSVAHRTARQEQDDAHNEGGGIQRRGEDGRGSERLSGDPMLGLSAPQFTYKCQYQAILMLQGRSAWLDHFLMELVCLL